MNYHLDHRGLFASLLWSVQWKKKDLAISLLQHSCYSFTISTSHPHSLLFLTLSFSSFQYCHLIYRNCRAALSMLAGEVQLIKHILCTCLSDLSTQLCAHLHHRPPCCPFHSSVVLFQFLFTSVWPGQWICFNTISFGWFQRMCFF